MPESEPLPADPAPEPESDAAQDHGRVEVEPAADPTELAPAVPDYAPSVPSPAGSRWSRLSRTAVLLLGVGLGAAVVGAGWLVTALPGDETETGSFTTDGTIALTSVGVGLDDGELCSGTGGYSDIRLGAQINVTDAAGTLVAHGSLGLGKKSDAGCAFPFTVDDVTPGSKFYTVEVSHRGGLTQTETELREGGLTFTLGD